MRLENKVAIVTGAGRGIGAALARGFAREGAAVVVNYAHSASAAESVVEHIRAEGGRAVAVQADVACLEEHAALVEAAINLGGHLDILVNNAGIQARVPALDATVFDWDRIMATNLRGPYFLAQRVARHMKDSGGGAVLNISSVHDEQAHLNNSIYTIAKGGLKLMTRNLALEWAPYGIRVNSLSPGAFLTDINRDVLSDEVTKEKVLARIPLHRAGNVDELIAAAILLVSGDGSYITGTTLYVDGGLLL